MMTYKNPSPCGCANQFEGYLRALRIFAPAQQCATVTVMPAAMQTLPPIRDFAAVSWDYDRTST